ncbi:hypothetical protein MMC31_007216 [Peltigera leucophlebia]|nr:hypothetical protein [Peltigera leucophlebia]
MFNNLLVLQQYTMEKLKALSLLESDEPSDDFWTFSSFPCPEIFADVMVQDGTIPCAFNTTAFSRYVGFEPRIAKQLLNDSENVTEHTAANMTELARKHVTVGGSECPNPWATPVSDESKVPKTTKQRWPSKDKLITNKFALITAEHSDILKSHQLN